MRKEQRVRIETAGLIAAALVLVLTLVAGVAVFLTTVNAVAVFLTLGFGACLTPAAGFITAAIARRALGY